MDTLKVSAAEFQRNIGRYQDLALRHPVAVTRNGRESTVLIDLAPLWRTPQQARYDPSEGDEWRASSTC